jgi:hypothetical protein
MYVLCLFRLGFPDMDNNYTVLCCDVISLWCIILWWKQNKKIEFKNTTVLYSWQHTTMTDYS